MTTHNGAEAKAHLSQLLDAAMKGEEVIVARDGKPLVPFVPETAPAARVLGFLDLAVPDELFTRSTRPRSRPGRDDAAVGQHA